jgi:hypothetical protein
VKAIFCFFLTLLVAGCAAPSPSLGTGQQAEAVPGNNPTTDFAGRHSGVLAQGLYECHAANETFAIIRSADELRGMWGLCFHNQAIPLMPAVDFDRYMIVGYAWGAQPSTGYTVSFGWVNLPTDPEHPILTAYVYRIQQPRHCPESDLIFVSGSMVTYPGILAVVLRSDRAQVVPIDAELACP